MPRAAQALLKQKRRYALELEPATTELFASRLCGLERGRGARDLVDVFYKPVVQPLGNLVILCAQAEASLLRLIAALQGSDERAAQIY